MSSGWLEGGCGGCWEGRTGLNPGHGLHSELGGGCRKGRTGKAGLKGPDNRAQANALGISITPGKALKGRPSFPATPV